MYAFQPIAFGRPAAGACTDPPDLNTPPGQSHPVGTYLSIEFEDYNIGCIATSWSATGLPPGLSIHAVSGVISGTPTTPGFYSVTITATNSYGSDNVSFIWSIFDEI
jgi:hypothetical protein